jgi:hypothetical protein
MGSLCRIGEEMENCAGCRYRPPAIIVSSNGIEAQPPHSQLRLLNQKSQRIVNQMIEVLSNEK